MTVRMYSVRLSKVFHKLSRTEFPLFYSHLTSVETILANNAGNAKVDFRPFHPFPLYFQGGYLIILTVKTPNGGITTDFFSNPTDAHVDVDCNGRFALANKYVFRR